MKPKSFRHLTARSRKRVLRRIARRWQDCANDLRSLESELHDATGYGEYSDIRDRIVQLQSQLKQIEHELQ